MHFTAFHSNTVGTSRIFVTEATAGVIDVPKITNVPKIDLPSLPAARPVAVSYRAGRR
jgi:hypothetical protein